MTRLVLAAAAFVFGASALEAQMPPAISAPKNAAMRAAAATNAHEAQMGDASSSDAPVSMQASQPAPAPAAASPSTRAGATTAAAARRDSAGSSRGAKGELSFTREVFSYDGAGRRDPFFSLLKSNDLRPVLSDLRLVTIIYDATGRNSVAILRDDKSKDQYRVKVGQTLGRMRVAAIQPGQVNFIIEEFGFSRQESLALRDSTKVRTK